MDFSFACRTAFALRRLSQPRHARGGARSARRPATLVAALASLLLAASGAHAVNPAPAQLFYVPFPEDQLLSALTAIVAGGGTAPSNPVTTYVSIAVVANGTIVYYDQWENGYDADIANPANLYSGGNPGGTQIWGDGDPSNGAPPGVPGDVLNAGQVIVLHNQLNTGNLLAIDFDGRDKIAATKTVALSRTGWSTGPNTLLAGSVEVFDTSNWGTDYRVPVGVDIPTATDADMFEYTGLAIQAGEGGATIQVDKEGDGSFAAAVVLNEGESYLVNGGVQVGARVISDRPVQVTLLTGDIGSNYESRDSSLLPVNLWSSSYYEPVSTGSNAGTTVWLYNPGAASLVVDYTTRNGMGVLTTTPLNVPANGYLPQVIPNGYGAHFASAGQPFYAFSTTDSTNGASGNQSWDWGFTLVPEDSLTPQVLIGLGLGRDPTSPTNPLENGNPVWVTPVNNGDTPVTIYVDYDADPATGPLTDPNGNKYDLALSLKELERALVYDPTDRDQTGMLLYTLTSGVKLAAAWGQDPSMATASAPGLDVGTGVPPLPLFSAGKNGTLLVDADGDGFISPGDTLLYTIAINNISRAPVPDILVQDTLAPGTTYVPNSTTFRNAANVVAAIPDDGVGTAFPLDGAGRILDPITALPVGGSYEVAYQVTVDAFADLPPGTTQLVNVCSATAVGITVGCTDTTPIYGRIGDFVWLDLDGDTIQDGGPEVGIPGVTVNLYIDLNGNGAIDGADSVIATRVTDGSGGYLFTGVPAGTYVVDVVDATVPPGLTLTTANDPTAVNLAGGEWRLDVDFGYRNQCDGVVCNNGDACHDPGTCDPQTGQCSPPTPRPDGSSCDDGNACTQTDVCTGGTCAGTDPVTCPAPGVCQLQGVCDPQTGQCTTPSAPDGTSCDDGNACTQTDVCTGGACAGTNPVVCPAPDVCHLEGVCDPQTGQCSNPTAPDGTQCNDGDLCTQTDVCTGGACGGTNPVVCPAPAICHLQGVCDPQTGQCTDPIAPDGTQCSDGDQCSIGDQCVGGQCLGVSTDCEICTDIQDNDDDGFIDCLDPSCPHCPPIVNTCKHPCVSQIQFQRRGLDLLRLQASLKPVTPIDPATEQVGLLITNANGVVIADMLAPGTVKRVGKAWTSTVKTAKAAGGIFKIRITRLPDDSYRVNLRAYGAMAAKATLATMSVQLVIGDDVAVATSTWAQLKAGWRVQLP